MSSYVYYKFKAQKTESRIAFDGTGISVFDLKKEIILSNNLGKASDFDLLLLDSSEKEYTDDNQLIPRSTSVIVKRMPPSKPGKGKAALYVAGVAPAPSGSSSRTDPKAASTSAAPAWNRAAGGAISKRFDGKDEKPHLKSSSEPAASSATSASVTEVSTVAEDEAARIKAMFQAQTEHWEETQERMSHATPIYNNRGGAPRRSFPTPHVAAQPFESKPLPPGYICHRCSKRGHWIQDCPTNDDRDYDNRPRIKRTTGIPRSFLKSVEVSAEGAPQGVMVTPEGGFVVAQPDSASWEKQRARVVPLTAADVREKAPSDASLACPICSKLLRDAVKTPCCLKTFDEECIQTHLLESDFVCPSCHSKVASLDKVTPDTTARERVRKYIEEEIAKSIAPTDSGRNTPDVSKPTTASNKGKSAQQKPPASTPPPIDDSEAVFDAQPGDTSDSNTAASYNNNNIGFSGMNNVAHANPLEAEIASAQAQIQQCMMMLSNPQLAPQMRLQFQMQLQQLTMHLNTLQQMSIYQAQAAAGGAGVSFGSDNFGAGGMNMMGMQAQMMGGSGYGNGAGYNNGGGYSSGHTFNNPGLLSDADSPYQRVAPNNRRRTQKRERPEDFVDVNGSGHKYPRYYES